jgi:HK97 family phage portal protein
MGVVATIRSALARTIAPSATVPVRGSGGWWPVVRESFPGAWQQNVEVKTDTALGYWAVYACVAQIATDISKLPLGLVEQDDEGIWTATTNPAYSPVLRKPNRYQTPVKFIEQWIVSKLLYGNTYVLKERDHRGVVVALYVLDPTRITPLVAPDGAVYYQLALDDLAGLTPAALERAPAAPSSEIIHDVMVPLCHPLIGVTPIYACGMAALQGQKILENATNFFANGSTPGGILTAPGAIDEPTATRLKETFFREFSGPNAGKLLVVSDGLKYDGLSMNATDAQLIEQLAWTAVPICACYRMPVFMIDSTKTPAYGNVEQLTIHYHSQCLQSLIVNLETLLDDGLGLGPVFGNAYGAEFDSDDLFWMDTQTRTKAANESIGSGALAPNEARKKYFGLGAVPGGDTPYLQQQYYSLEALAQRDAEQPFAKPVPAAVPTEIAAKAWAADFRLAVRQKAVTRGLLRAA